MQLLLIFCNFREYFCTRYTFIVKICKMKHRKNIYIKTAPQQKPGEPPPDDDKAPPSQNSDVSEVWLPESSTAMKLLMSANLASALMNGVTDCDETYNYWEPLHHFLYGEGMQTWEYSPVFAIRSWTYIFLHSVFTWIYLGLLNSNKLMMFYFIRMVLAVVCTLCEVQFYDGVALRFGNNVARMTLAVLVFAPGMFISATAFLPSSFCMYMTFLLMGFWLQGHLHYAILTVAAASILGWPFSVVLGIPLAIDILLRRQKYLFFVKWCFIALATMLLPSVLIDSYYYGKPVVACLNILLYNVFTEHGPDLYGTAPLSYYLLNGFLNFNIMFILALVSFVVVPIAESIIKLKYKGYQPPSLLLAFTFLPMFIWIIIFFSQPHKEERFLFPIYPLICLCGAATFATLQKVYCVFQFHKYVKLHWFTAVTLTTYIVLSLSRSIALYQGYHAALDLYPNLHNFSVNHESDSEAYNVCFGKEWHRFPSSFFLPHNFTLKFIQSDFRGQLPQPFVGPGTVGTRAILSTFNDQNLEEANRYVDVDNCHFLVDFNSGIKTKREPIFSADSSRWLILEELDFLDTSSSPIFFRAFYVPYYYSHKNKFGKYQLLQSKYLT